jgi:hypothetical protein
MEKPVRIAKKTAVTLFIGYLSIMFQMGMRRGRDAGCIPPLLISEPP